MSRWVRGIYNTAANFVMSGSLRAASGRTLDRESKHVREISDKRDQHVESSQSGESNKLGNSTGTTTTGTSATSVIIGNDVIITDSRDICDTECNKCHPTFCDHIERDYADYTASIRTEGQGAGSWIRLSDESGSFKRTNSDAADSIERCTGIPTGVTI